MSSSSTRLSPLPTPYLAGSSSPPRSPRLPRSPILCHPLPPSNTINLESLAQSELTLHLQTLDRQRERDLAEALQEATWSIERQSAKEELGNSNSLGRKTLKGKEKTAGSGVVDSKGFIRPPQAYELYQAIDRKDIDFIMRVRDHAFGLLLQKNAGEFPIVYASRIGEGHRDVVILLIGAMSRYVNHLEPEDFEKKQTKDILKALRSNLKLAIDNTLLPSSAPTSTNLLSSYLQVLIMSEGDTWLYQTIHELSVLLRHPDLHEAKPVKSAEEMVRAFCTKELRGVKGGVSGVEEYIANAGLDLVIMGTWSLAAGQMGLDLLPTHTFARDTRTWTMLKESMEENAGTLNKVSRKIRGILDTLLEIGGDTKKSVRGRLKDVALALDGE